MPSWLQDIRVFAWDLDGTLYPSNAEFNEAIQQRVLQRVALALKCSLVTAQSVFEEKKRKVRSSTQVLKSFGIDGQQFFVDTWNTLPLETYIPPNPQLAQLLQEATTVRHLLHTNSNSLETVEKKLRCIGIPIQVFSKVMTSLEMGVEKPHPKAFQLLIAAAEVEPEEILYIGDREDVDIVPASKAGLKTCFIHPSNTPVSRADMRVATPQEVLHLLHAQ